MESSEQARDIYGRCRTTDESYVVGSNADHCKSVRDSRMPNLNNTYEAGVPFKAQPCCDFRTRGCGYGTACRYSHEFRGTNQGETVVKDIKVGSCKWYAKGKQCPYGNNCRFPHEDVKNDTGEFRDSHAISIVAAGDKQDSSLEQDNRLVGLSSGAKQDNRPVDVSLRANRENQRSVYWKTKLCNRWETVKECLYGSNCSYAHGLAELLPRPSPRYGNLSLRSVAGVANDDKNGVAQVEGEKGCSDRWKTGHKVIGIYADWIDNMPFQPDA